MQFYISQAGFGQDTFKYPSDIRLFQASMSARKRRSEAAKLQHGIKIKTNQHLKYYCFY